MFWRCIEIVRKLGRVLWWWVEIGWIVLCLIYLLICQLFSSVRPKKSVAKFRIVYIDRDEWYREYRVDGALHRTDGPAIEFCDGIVKKWYNMGQLHRLDGPAEELNGASCWWVDGKLHRLDGPAFETDTDYREWWINDQELTRCEFERHPLVIFHQLSKLKSESLDG
jgi:hypothetical protein